MTKKLMMSWNDRFALIDHFAPSDNQACAVFGLSQSELETARDLRAAGTFASTPNFDVTQYTSVFSADNMPVAISNPVPVAPPTVVVKPAVATQVTTRVREERPVTAIQPKGTATTHAKPETASRKVKEPQKRGRKGDKITRALTAVPTTPTPVDAFIAEHGVSLAVLRQSKRFMASMDAATIASIGKINVRQDKTSHQLMIWREVEGA